MLKVDMEGLFIAFMDDSVEKSYYLDRDSGHVFNLLEDHDDPETQELVWQLESDTRGRYIPIPKPSMEQKIEVQDTFVESLENAELKERFEKVIESDHDGSKFADFVDRDRHARDAWRAFRKVRAKDEAREWVNTLNLPSV